MQVLGQGHRSRKQQGWHSSPAVQLHRVSPTNHSKAASVAGKQAREGKARRRLLTVEDLPTSPHLTPDSLSLESFGSQRIQGSCRGPAIHRVSLPDPILAFLLLPTRCSWWRWWASPGPWCP